MNTADFLNLAPTLNEAREFLIASSRELGIASAAAIAPVQDRFSGRLRRISSFYASKAFLDQRAAELPAAMTASYVSINSKVIHENEEILALI